MRCYFWYLCLDVRCASCLDTVFNDPPCRRRWNRLFAVYTRESEALRTRTAGRSVSSLGKPYKGHGHDDVSVGRIFTLTYMLNLTDSGNPPGTPRGRRLLRGPQNDLRCLLHAQHTSKPRIIPCGRPFDCFVMLDRFYPVRKLKRIQVCGYMG